MFKKNSVFDQELDACLELLEAAQDDLDSALASYPSHGDALRPSLEAAQWLRKHSPELDVRPGFVKASRQRLEKRLQQASARRPPWAIPWALTPAWFRLTVYMVVFPLLVIALALNGRTLGRASAAWLPGDGLYPLKLAAENINLLLSPGAENQARLHIQFAQRRLLEVQSLALENRYEDISPAVTDLDRHVQGAVIALNRLARQDFHTTQLLAADLEEILSSQSDLVILLQGFAPRHARADLARVRVISENGVEAVKEMLSPEGSRTDHRALHPLHRLTIL